MATPKVRPHGETLQFMQGVWRLLHALDVRSKRMARTIGVTGAQRLVIRIIGQGDDQMAGEIAAMLGMHPSTLTGVLSRLEDRGMIVRVRDADDRRRARFTLTAAGKRIDRARTGTVEAACRRALARADPTAVAGMNTVLALVVEELGRND